MNAQQQQTLEAIRQADAIMALEGFQPTDDMKIVQNAVLAGRVTFGQVADELRDYVAIHKTIDGFIQTRHWAKKGIAMAHLQAIIESNPLSKTHYISGQQALNIDDFEHHTGDWHTLAAWGGDKIEVKRFTLMGDGEEYNTNPYFGDKGIIDATDILRRMGKKPIAPVVWAANHSRAIADIIICNVLTHNRVNSFTLYEFDAWFSEQADKQRVYTLLEQALPKLPLTAQTTLSNWLKTAKETDFDA